MTLGVSRVSLRSYKRPQGYVVLIISYCREEKKERREEMYMLILR